MGLSQGKQGLVKVVDLRGHVVVHHHDLVGVHDFIGVQASQAHHTLEGVGQDLMPKMAATIPAMMARPITTPMTGAIQSGVGVPWEKVEPVAKIMEALLSFLRIFGKPEGIDELLVFRAGSSKGFEAIEASGRVNDLSTHDHRGVLTIATGVGNGHMPVHGGEGILVNLQKTSDIGQDLTFLRVIEPLGVLDLLPSEFGDGHSVVDVILVIDRRIAGISAGGILIGVLLRNAREIDGIAQILGRELLPALGAVTEEVALFADGASRLGGTAGGQTCRESHRCYDSGNPPERPFHIKPFFLSCRFLFFHCNTF